VGNNFRQWFVMALALSVLGQPAFAQDAADAVDSSGHEPKTIVGAWSNTVHPTQRPAFVGLGIFTKDGNLTNTTSDSLAFPTETPGFGRWTRTGPRTYAATFVTLIGAPDGTFAATAKIRAAISLSASGDEFTGTFRVDVFDPTGAPIGADTGRVTGTRIKVEPL
jgi:hypothetical protein